MPQNLAAPPLQTPLIESIKTLEITKVWADWLRSVVNRAQTSAYLAITAVSLSTQSASIGLTSLIPLGSGLYRVSYRLRVVTVAGASSSVAVSFSTIDGAIVVTYDGAAYTGNANDEPQTGSFIVRVDPSSPLSYSVTYASTPAGMTYDLDILVEAL